jgi:DNA invertase Pin-like site-specific DNA recombinase
MGNALIVRKSLLPKSETGSRAAQYVRMSTDHQKYSPENQRTAIAAYAAQRGIAIVRSYADDGRSGLTILKRDGLNDLIRDIQREQADFNCILVYDVSRWGRFQDVDESAYYEFICKREGVTVHYCEEEFENDGSLASVLMKSVSRVEAASFSKRLSKRVFMAQSLGVSLGFWRGGSAPYGYRRQAVDKDGVPRGILAPGQQKPFKSDRVILVPGSKREIAVVRRIFGDFASRKKTRSELANELNAKGISNSQGNPWQMQTIDILLRNEVYLGHNVYNRRSMKLQQRPVDNPPEMWVRHDNAFEAIIPRALFAKAQKVLADLEYRQALTDQELLDKLRALWRKEGDLSMRILEASEDTPSWNVFTRRFGSLMNAYKLIGFKPQARYRYAETGTKIDAIIRAAAASIVSKLRIIDETVSFLPELNLISAKTFTVIIAVAWSVSDGTIARRRSRRWEVRKIKYRRSDLTLVIRMDKTNNEIQDYFLLPTPNLPLTKDQKKLRISDRVFGSFGHSNFNSVLRALRDAYHQRDETVDFATKASRVASTRPRMPSRLPATGRSKRKNDCAPH